MKLAGAKILVERGRPRPDKYSSIGSYRRAIERYQDACRMTRIAGVTDERALADHAALAEMAAWMKGAAGRYVEMWSGDEGAMRICAQAGKWGGRAVGATIAEAWAALKQQSGWPG